MRIKLYKIMGVTPSGGHWFLKAKPMEGGLGGDWVDYTLYSKERIAEANAYSTRTQAENALTLFVVEHPTDVISAYGSRGLLHVDYPRLTMSVVEFTAEV